MTEHQSPSTASPTMPEQYAFPLTFAQQRLWFLEQMDPGQPAYLITWALEISGKLNTDALEESLNVIIARHEILRTTFEMVGDEPKQIVHSAMKIVMRRERVLDDRNSHDTVTRAIDEESRTPLDLRNGPLLRARLLNLADDRHVLLMTTHHIVFDGWSRYILIQELAALYEAATAHTACPLPEIDIQYGDYAVWQREHLNGSALEHKIEYWKDRLSGAPAVLDLPTDHPRPALQSFHGSLFSFSLTPELSRAIRSLAHEEKATLFMVLLAAFQILLARYSGQDDIVLGTPSASRDRVELESLIGLFANTTVLRSSISGDLSFKQHLQVVKETCLGAFENQEVPFEKLVEELKPERDLSHNPIFQVLFSLRNTPRDSFRLSGLDLKLMGRDHDTAKFDLSLYLHEEQDQVHGRIEYNTDLFERATIERMARHYQVLLSGAVAQPSCAISKLPLITEDERAQLRAWNKTERPYPQKCLYELFESQVAEDGARLAVTFENERLTYAALNGEANRVAHLLLNKGITARDRVGICLSRSHRLLIAMLAVQKTGASYVPLDPTYPAQRISQILDGAEISALLTEEAFAAAHFAGLSDAPIVCLDRDHAEIADSPDCNPNISVDPTSPIYTIFTSGSTGRPKGVTVAHKAVVNLLSYLAAEWNFTTADIFPAIASFAFDMSVPELYLPLICGAVVAVCPRELASDGEGLAKLLHECKATIVHVTPTTWRLLLDAGFVSTGVRRAIGAEPLPSSLFGQLLAAGEPLYNLYGPTETTVWSTLHRFENANERVVIGRPIANTQIYILDSQLEPVPIGVRGEIHIGGDGVAIGYLNQPELTHERFIANPFSNTSGARLYKTGDLGLYLADGTIEFQHRRDHQVKIRGFRIELGEIELAISKCKGIKECIVVAHECGTEDKRLAAYVVSDRTAPAEPAQIKRHLSQHLPEYMVPSSFTLLDAFPLTPNGKIDRKALPDPQFRRDELGNEFIAARTPIEDILANIWAEVLRIDRVGSGDNFFALGGHSLLATQVISRVRESFKIDLPLRALFEAPTVESLAQRIEAAQKQCEAIKRPELVAVARDQDLPLSFAQQRLWFLEQLEPDSARYHVPLLLRVHGRLDFAVLRRSLDAVLQRHEALRTAIVLKDGEPMQSIRDCAFPMSITDLRDVPAGECEGRLNELVLEVIRRPFDLSAAPMIRAALFQLAEQDHVLAINMHHIASDGWSLSVFRRDLAAFYDAYILDAKPKLPPLSVQYADFSVWQRQLLSGEALDEQVSFWKNMLEGAPDQIDLATDKPRPVLQTFHGDHLTMVLSSRLLKSLRILSRGSHVSLYMTLLGAFSVLLSRYSGQEDIVIGSPIAGRGHRDVENLVGFFVNTVVLRTDLSGNPTFGELMARVREASLNAYHYQDLPFEKLVEQLRPNRDLSRNAIFQVFFALQNIPSEKMDFGGLKLEPFSIERYTSKFDVSLFATELEDGLRLTFEYNTDLFERATIERMARHFEHLLRAIVSDAERPLSAISIMDEAEHRQLLTGFHPSRIESRAYQPSHRIFEQQAARTPDAIALVCGEEQLSYGELNLRANGLARHLRKIGVSENDLVGIHLPRSMQTLIALLAVHKAGAAYVPLDPAFPRERIDHMISDSGLRFVISQGSLAAAVPAPIRVIALDEEAAEIVLQTVTDLVDISDDPERLAYVLYTSGSTGRPKGVMVPQRALSNFLLSMQVEPGMAATDTLLAVTTLSFDIAQLELLLPLCVGGKIVIASRDQTLDGFALARMIDTHQITVLQATPATWRLLIEAGWRGDTRLKALCGGEALDEALACELLSRCGSLWNMYGPTETTIWSSVARIVDPTRITLGHPVANTRFYILDKYKNPAPIGVPGELHIGGDGLARGYLHRQDLTEKFITDPFSAEQAARLYKTGDLVKRLPDGEITFLGRIDQQIKIRGFRVELGEIEAQISDFAGVKRSVVMLREIAGDKRIVAFIEARDRNNFSIDALRVRLQQCLPEYMVPSSFTLLDAFPLTPNGKIDRKALPDPQFTREEQSDVSNDPIELQLTHIWQEVLSIRSIDVNDDFFRLGGHSLLAVKLMSRIREHFGQDLPLTLLFQSTTIRALARIIRQDGFQYSTSTLVPIRPTGSRPALFCVAKPNTNALGFLFLARNLSEQYPVFGLQSQMRTYAESDIYTQEDYEKKASEYIAAMRDMQPNGPYFLTGFCEGSHIAFEMARQLDNAGQEVGLLAILDTWPVENTINPFRFRLRSMYRKIRRFAALNLKEMMRRIKLRLKFRTQEERFPEAVHQQRVIKSGTQQMFERYWPGPDWIAPTYAGKLTLFRLPWQPFHRIYDREMGWAERALGGVEVVKIPGGHRLILREPSVSAIAKEIEARIEGVLVSHPESRSASAAVASRMS